MAITTEQVKELRDRTGISVMQCRKALEEANGDMEKAIVILRKKSGDIAEKKADRILKAAAIQSYIHNTGRVGVMVELSCESDFVSGNEEYKTLARDIAMHIAATKPEYMVISEVSEEAMKTAKEVFVKEVEGKPENMKEKILQSKLDAYFGERVLLSQPFIKNPEVTIEGLIQQAIQKFGEKIELTRFVRYSVDK